MFYQIAKFAVYFYLKILYDVEIVGAENIPSKGGVLICSNHGSNLDSVVVATHIKRTVNYLGKKELFKNKFTSYWLKKMRVFPVSRDTVDMNAFRFAVDLLKSGEAVGIFAQGTRVKEGEEGKAKGGVALFAVKADVPIVPVCIVSDYRLFKKIKMVVGAPISFSAYKDQKIRTEKLNELSESVMNEVSKLGHVSE